MPKRIVKHIGKSFFSTQFLKFLLVGGLAAFINFFSRFFFRIFVSYISSVILAYILGTIFSFIFNKIFTFKEDKQKTLVQGLKFFVIALSAIIIAALVVSLIMFIYNFFNISYINEQSMESFAHIVAIGVTTIYNFLTMRFFAFKKLRSI
ncbi:MAG: GtrA family protein [Candidatus Margulisiibacteriota bacterium]|jgi:putative flippase GtrA